MYSTRPNHLMLIAQQTPVYDGEGTVTPPTNRWRRNSSLWGVDIGVHNKDETQAFTPYTATHALEGTDLPAPSIACVRACAPKLGTAIACPCCGLRVSDSPPVVVVVGKWAWHEFSRCPCNRRVRCF